MSSDFYSGDEVVERGSIPLDIDNIHMLLQGQSASSNHMTLFVSLYRYLTDQSYLFTYLFIMVFSNLFGVSVLGYHRNPCTLNIMMTVRLN